MVKAPVDSMIKQASATADGMLFTRMLIVVKGLSYKEASYGMNKDRCSSFLV